MIRDLTTIGMLGMATLLTQGSEINFSYAHPGDVVTNFGSKKPDSYDVAIKITDPFFIGAKVKGINVEMPVAPESVESLSGWVSSELVVENKVNIPDISQVEAMLDNGTMSATFPELPLIPEGGIYVGYSFTTLERGGISDTPVVVAECEENSENAFWLHSKKSYSKWTNLAESKGLVSTMTVTLETEYGDYELALSLPAENYAAASSETDPAVNKIHAEIINLGDNEVNGFEYSYIIGGDRRTGTIELETPLSGNGSRMAVTLPIDIDMQVGDYDFSASIDKCGGFENPNPYRQASSILHVWPFVPKTRILVEEYTGLGCGYCPEGYIIMEEMHRKYGDLMVGAAFHSKTFESGAMVTVDNKDFPITPDGYPFASVNRTNGMSISKLPGAIPPYLTEIVPVRISADLANKEDGDSEICSDISVSFAQAANGQDYRLEAILVADGLKNDRWQQTNYFSGKTDPESIESDLWDIFLNGEKQVSGLTFNDVVVYYKEDMRNFDPFPTVIESGDVFEYNVVISLNNILNIRKQPLLNDGCTLRLVALVIDNHTGEVVNCNESNSLQFHTSGVKDVSGNSEIVKTIFTTIDGITVPQPTKGGIYLRTDCYRDGSRRTYKIH